MSVAYVLHTVKVKARLWSILLHDNFTTFQSVKYLHKLKRCFKILNRVHLNSEKLDPHDEADGALDHRRTLLFLPQLLQLIHELFLHGRKPVGKQTTSKCEDMHLHHPASLISCGTSGDVG